MAVEINKVASVNPTAQTPDAGSNQSLNQIIQMSLLSEINTELNNVGNEMKTRNEERGALRETITNMNNIYSYPSQKSGLMEAEVIIVTADEKNYLISQGISPEAFTDSHGQQSIKKDTLKRALDGKQETLAGFNSESELTAIKIQSLVDQRKNLTLLLSNLMSSENDTLMSIIRNLKG